MYIQIYREYTYNDNDGDDGDDDDNDESNPLKWNKTWFCFMDPHTLRTSRSTESSTM